MNLRGLILSSSILSDSSIYFFIFDSVTRLWESTWSVFGRASVLKFTNACAVSESKSESSYGGSSSGSLKF